MCTSGPWCKKIAHCYESLLKKQLPAGLRECRLGRCETTLMTKGQASRERVATGDRPEAAAAGATAAGASGATRPARRRT
jgi:hypothetical protein